MKKILFGFIFAIVVSLFVFLKPVHASDNFKTNYAVTYTVNDEGMTQAKFAIVLENVTTQYYASFYKIAVGFDDISNVKASDPGGTITPTVVKTDSGYTIDVRFNSKIVGQGNKLPFSITFDTPSVAKKNGSIWEINIPGIQKQNDFEEFIVDIKVPDTFGKASVIKPHKDDNTLQFNKAQLGKSGISVAFGEKQAYAFTLVYHLRNKNVFPLPTEIAIPPSTNYQEVFIDDITPRPLNVLQDVDGNWLAQYRLLPSQKLDVTVKGRAQIQLTPKKESLSEAEKREYVKDKAYWNVSSPQIQQLAKQYNTPKKIYDYVVKTLTYDYSRIAQNKSRIGAPGVLANAESAVCTEFTDLFIAIARAAGIPAREINGYGFTQNTEQRPVSLEQDTLLHAWPEYYDEQKQTWIMVDPTWANTTGGVDYFSQMDFNHITFVRKGIDSTYPIYAGGYKYEEDKNAKDVQVTFAKVINASEQNIELYTDLAPVFLSGLPIQGTLVVKNIGKNEVSPQIAQVISESIVSTNDRIDIADIPPYGYIEQPLYFRSTPILTNGEYPFTITLADKKIYRKITVTPFIVNKVTVSGGIVLALLIISLFIFTFKTRRISVFR